jgi:hypothetical protein
MAGNLPQIYRRFQAGAINSARVNYLPRRALLQTQFGLLPSAGVGKADDS